MPDWRPVGLGCTPALPTTQKPLEIHRAAGRAACEVPTRIAFERVAGLPQPRPVERTSGAMIGTSASLSGLTLATMSDGTFDRPNPPTSGRAPSGPESTMSLIQR